VAASPKTLTAMVTWSSLRLAPWISCATFTTTTTEALPFHPGLPNQAEKPRLHHNNGNGTFTDVTDRMRLDRVILSMGLGFGDLNNRGFLDCYCGTGTPDYEALLPNRMFRNDHGRVFQATPSPLPTSIETAMKTSSRCLEELHKATHTWIHSSKILATPTTGSA
jgi:hypothetical protein